MSSKEKLEILNHLIYSHAHNRDSYKRIMDDNAGELEHSSFLPGIIKGYEEEKIMVAALEFYREVIKSEPAEEIS